MDIEMQEPYYLLKVDIYIYMHPYPICKCTSLVLFAKDALCACVVCIQIPLQVTNSPTVYTMYMYIPSLSTH